MGVYIKNMEMPKSGTYEVSIDTTNGKDKTIMSMFVRGAGGLICCGVYELVPVPPHGRLVDADKLGFAMMDAANVDQALAMVDDAPTVIPAEPPKEDT